MQDREFVGEVCAAFGLGAPRSIRAIGGGANLVWRLESESGVQVVKELPADSAEVLGRAAEFERAVFGAGVVPMAEPRADREGRLLRPMRGSRGEPALVRVHRSVQGREPGRPVAAATARAAGRSLARVQTFGAGWDGQVGPLPDKRVWLRPDRETFDAFAGSRPELIKDGWAALVEAEELVSEWVGGARGGISTHCDHKPENSLRDGEKLIILDWDEAGACDPRIEAVERLRAGPGPGTPVRMPGSSRTSWRAIAKRVVRSNRCGRRTGRSGWPGSRVGTNSRHNDHWVGGRPSRRPGTTRPRRLLRRSAGSGARCAEFRSGPP